VSTSRLIGCFVALFVLSACGTPESAAWVTGVSPADAREISRVIQAQTSKPIDSYAREPNGSIVVWMRTTKGDPYYGFSSNSGFGYVVRKVNGKWKIVDHEVVLL
jgi:hypothetical protein